MKRYFLWGIIGALSLAHLCRGADPLDSWTPQESPWDGGLSRVTYGKEQLVAVGLAGAIVTSSDGKSWTKRDSGTTCFLTGIAYGNGVFVATGNQRFKWDPTLSVIITSRNGIDWTTASSSQGQLYRHGEYNDVAFGNGNFVIVGRSYFDLEDYNNNRQPHHCIMLTSPDGTTWTEQPLMQWAQYPSGITYGNGLFAVCTDNPIDHAWGSTEFCHILTSPDGATWSTAPGINESATYFTSITYGNGRFVAVGNHDIDVGDTFLTVARVLTSSNAVDWVLQRPGTADSLSGVSYGNGRFVAVGSWGNIVTSRDGLNWTDRAMTLRGGAYYLNDVCFGNDIFVAVGGGSTILTSETSTDISILKPREDSRPHSGFVALEGIANSPSRDLVILVEGQQAATATTDPSGNWEAVVYVGLGAHILEAQYGDDPQIVSSEVHIENVFQGSVPKFPSSFFSSLRKADVLCAAHSGGPQRLLYGPTFTHTGVFVGGDDDGTPLIAEAIPKSWFFWGGTGARPIEQSSFYRNADWVVIYRDYQLATSVRAAIARQAYDFAELRPPYNFQYFTAIAACEAWWNPVTHWYRRQPLFLSARDAVEREKYNTQRFTCATLVWRAYWEGSGQSVDLSNPSITLRNPPNDYILNRLDPALVVMMSSRIVAPDTIAQNPALKLVTSTAP